MKATAMAHTNIALIKYWGKRDETLFLPMNSSLSITLDKFYTTTTVEFCTHLYEDVFILNGSLTNEAETQKVTRFLNIVRKMSGKELFAIVKSNNKVPTAAGFASSASGYAALAAASTKAIGLDIDNRTLSKIARLGSGSACRSIYGGFVEWQKGEEEDGSDSFAKPIIAHDSWDISILSVLITANQKKVLSREGMKRVVETSPFYSSWPIEAEKDLIIAKKAIQERDFDELGRVTEANALKMHATTLGANPPFLYWQSATIDVIQKVQELRSIGLHAYFTIDAGPNVKIICLPQDEQAVKESLHSLPAIRDVYSSRIGPGVQLLA
ncbi:MAG: diphosphomevalonate decarboxylase [Bacillota bacterium]|nr:diphosphomevalonate decarboxylase [Bacillota bacterium]